MFVNVRLSVLIYHRLSDCLLVCLTDCPYCCLSVYLSVSIQIHESCIEKQVLANKYMSPFLCCFVVVVAVAVVVLVVFVAVIWMHMNFIIHYCSFSFEFFKIKKKIFRRKDRLTE